MTREVLPQLGRLLIVTGIVLLIVGAIVAYARFLRLGALPGDFTWSGRTWQISVPLGTSILISVILTIVLNLLLMRKR